MPFRADHAEKASVFEASDSEDVRSATQICYDHDIPIVIRGEGTGHTAGAFNFASGLVLDTTKMNRVLDLDASKGTITVETGITIDDLREVALGVGWDMRQYPTPNIAHKATLGGFLQTTPYGIGSARYGSTMDFGNIINMKIVPVTESIPLTQLDGVMDQTEVHGSLRALGTSTIMTEVTLALAPAEYWVDMGVSFSTLQSAMKFALNTHNSPTLSLRELAVLPSSMLTAALNQGERKSPIHFFRNRVPPADHEPNTHIPQEDLGNFDLQDYATPDFMPETEALVILSVNEASVHFLNHIVKSSGGHTIYLEHSRGGFGLLEASTWHQANIRLARYYNDAQFSHYELGMGVLDDSSAETITQQMQLVSEVINESISHQQDTKLRILPDGSNWVDERSFLGNGIKERPSWLLEFIRMPTGRSGLVAFTNFRVQTANFLQLEQRLDAIQSGLLRLKQEKFIQSIVNPNACNPAELFIDDTDEHERSRLIAKSKFDPKSLLNPRTILI